MKERDEYFEENMGVLESHKDIKVRQAAYNIGCEISRMATEIKRERESRVDLEARVNRAMLCLIGIDKPLGS